MENQNSRSLFVIRGSLLKTIHDSRFTIHDFKKSMVYGLWSLVLSALLIGSMTISGCGKAAETVAGGAGGGTGGGSGSDISATSILVKGTTELLSKELAAMGITGVTLPTTLSTENSGNVRVASIPLAEQNAEGSVTYSDLGLGTSFGSTSNINNELKFQSTLEITSALVATSQIKVDGNKDGDYKDAEDSILVKKALILKPETTITAGATEVAVECSEKNSAAAAMIFEKSDVREAIANLSKVSPKDAIALVNSAAQAIAKANLSNLPITTTFVMRGNEIFDEKSGLSKGATEAIRNQIQSSNDATQERESFESAAKKMGPAASLRTEKDKTKVDAARLQLANDFVSLIGIPKSVAKDIGEKLAADTRTYTIAELIANAVAHEGKTIPSTLTVDNVVNNLKAKLTELNNAFTNIKEGKTNFTQIKTASINPQDEGPKGPAGPPIEIMAGIKSYMDSKLINGQITAEIRWDYFCLPAMCELSNEKSLADGSINTMATMKRMGLDFVFDQNKGQMGIDLRADFFAAGAKVTEVKGQQTLYCDIMGFGGGAIKNAATCEVTIGSKKYSASKVDLSAINNNRKPDVLFTISANGTLDQHWKNDFGLTSNIKVTAVSASLTESDFKEGKITVSAVFKDSKGAEIASLTETRPIGAGPDVQTVKITLEQPVFAGPEKQPTNYASGNPIPIRAFHEITGNLPSGITKDNVRFVIRLDQMDMAANPKPGEPFKPIILYESPLLIKPVGEIPASKLTNINGFCFVGIEALAEDKTGGRMHLGFVGTPIIYGNANTVFSNAGNFAKGLDVTKYEEVDLIIKVKLLNAPEGNFYAAIVQLPILDKGEIGMTNLYSGEVDSTSKTASITVPKAKVADLRGKVSWDIIVFGDRNKNGKFDDAIKEKKAGEMIDFKTEEYPIKKESESFELHGNILAVRNMNSGSAATELSNNLYTLDMKNLGTSKIMDQVGVPQKPNQQPGGQNQGSQPIQGQPVNPPKQSGQNPPPQNNPQPPNQPNNQPPNQPNNQLPPPPNNNGQQQQPFSVSITTITPSSITPGQSITVIGNGFPMSIPPGSNILVLVNTTTSQEVTMTCTINQGSSPTNMSLRIDSVPQEIRGVQIRLRVKGSNGEVLATSPVTLTVN